MNNSILLSAQRKVLGGYMNAEEHAIGADRNIMKTDLREAWFDIHFHKVIVRAIKNLQEHNTTVTGISVEGFIDAYGYPKTIEQQNEFLELLTEVCITKASFDTYIELIIKKHNENKGEEV